jgi:hypothetical protein
MTGSPDIRSFPIQTDVKVMQILVDQAVTS